MNSLLRERPMIFLLKLVFYVYLKMRNKFYSAAFSTRGLVVGRNISIVGTKNISIGNHVILGNQTWLDCIDHATLIIGDDVSLSQNVHVSAMVEVRIGNGCLIGSDVLVTDHDHSFGPQYNKVLPKNRPLMTRGKTILGRNVWLGDNVKVLSGVSLGDNVVVASNSVVNRSFPDNVVIGGIPAKILKAF